MIRFEVPAWVALGVPAVGVLVAVVAGVWLGRRARRQHRRDLARVRARTVARAARYAEGRAAVSRYAAGAGIAPAPLDVVQQAEQDAAVVLAAIGDRAEPEPMHGDGDPGDLPPRLESRYPWPAEAAPRPRWTPPVGWLR